MKIKKTITASLLSLALGCSVMSNANASGVPTVDVAAAAQLVQNALETAKQAADQLQAYENMIDQAKGQFNETKDLISGNWELGNFLDTQLMDNVIPENWKDIYNNLDDLNDLRDKFGLKSDNPVIQEQYDKMLAGYDMLQKADKTNNQRVQNLQELGSLLNSANTPQQKGDLQLRLQVEQINIQNEQNRLQNVAMLMEQQQQIIDKGKAKSFKDNMRK